MLVTAVVLMAAPASFAANPKAPTAADPRVSARADLVAAIHAYRQALERLMEFHVAAVSRAAAEVDKRRELLAGGLVSRRDLEDSERMLVTAEAKVTATRREMVVTDQSLAEAMIEPPSPAPRPGPPGRPAPEQYEATPWFVHYRGPAHWTLAEAPKVQDFFARRFGRALPVSAFGQTPVHDRLGFDHRQALDVAVTPDSPEGTVLMAFLRGAGISFMAFRGAVAGEATGAHIHIGQASRRL